MKFLAFLLIFSSIFSDEKISTTYKDIHAVDLLLFPSKKSQGNDSKYPLLSFNETSDEELSEFSLRAYNSLSELGWSCFFVSDIAKVANNCSSIKPPKVFHIDSIDMQKTQGLHVVLKHLKKRPSKTKVSFNLLGVNINPKNRSAVLAFLKEYADVVFCDNNISRQLTGLSPKLSCQYFSNIFSIKTIIFENNGFWAASDKLSSSFHPFSSKVDFDKSSLFICGVLHGILKDELFTKCLDMGAFFIKAY